MRETHDAKSEIFTSTTTLAGLELISALMQRQPAGVHRGGSTQIHDKATRARRKIERQNKKRNRR